MKIITRKDIFGGIATGLTTGLILWGILLYFHRPLPFGVPAVMLAVVPPVLWVLGVQFGYVLGIAFKPLTEFGRFVCIGFANFSVDAGILLVGMIVTHSGADAGILYAILKSISFAVATVHSYFWNKYWAFNAGGTKATQTEIASFVTVALTGMLVNVLAASVVRAFQPAAYSAVAWGTISGMVGSAVALMFSFVGFRVFVFKKK